MISIDELDQITNRSVGFDRMPQRTVETDRISILPAHPLPLDKSTILELADDSLYGAFGDANTHGHLPEHDRGVSEKQHEHMAVIREKCPTGRHFRVRSGQ